MALNAERFTRTTLAFNAGVSTLSDASNVNGPSAFTYATATDTLATVAAANYFNSEAVVYDLQIDDLITCVCSDGGQILRVATVDAISNPKTITTVVFASGSGSGQYIEAEVLSGAPTSLVSGVSLDITSISVPAGEWDVFGVVGLNTAATTSVTLSTGWASATSASFGTDFNGVSRPIAVAAGVVPGELAQTHPIPTLRFSLSATTTIYLSTAATFTVDTASAYGKISASRVG